MHKDNHECTFKWSSVFFLLGDNALKTKGREHHIFQTEVLDWYNEFLSLVDACLKAQSKRGCDPRS